MGMVVRTNTMSANAYRQLGTNNTQLSKSLEKLSSGYRINRAGDDASGLAISEKMKAQIQGLTQASANSQDGISLVQTAEGALTEVHSMLNRMVELATKSANGTIQDDVDRDAIQTEVDALNTEITRIAKSTNFNGINLLDGSLNGETSVTLDQGIVGAYTEGLAGIDCSNDSIETSGADVGTSVHFEVVATGSAETSSWSGTTLSISLAIGETYNQDNIDNLIENATGSVPAGASGLKINLGGGTLSPIHETSGAGETITLTNPARASFTSSTYDITVSATKCGAKNNGMIQVSSGSTESAAADPNGGFELNLISSKEYSANDINTLLSNANVPYMMEYDDTLTGSQIDSDFDSMSYVTGGAGLEGDTTGTGASGNGLTLQVGATDDAFNKVTVSIDDMTSEGLGIKGLDVSTQDAAGDAIETIEAAINKVSTNRGSLGALQNRLEYATNSLDTTAENMDAANSRIRDTDMAKEMMTYTKMNILSQAAQAMLAQANQQPQNILQLLQ